MNNSNSIVHQIRSELEQEANPDKARHHQGFFKTGPGGYGEGDMFIGVSLPAQRRIAKKYRDTPAGDLAQLLCSEIHEQRSVALLIMVEAAKLKSCSDERRREFRRLYLDHMDYVNNWDLVDISAHYILGPWMLAEPEQRMLLYKLARSENLWHQRIAIITTFAFIRAGEFKDTFNIAELLLDHPHDLIHKAVGWMLREVGNRDRKTEEQFLNPRYNTMPRTMLRYAIEKFPEKQRQDYLKGRI
ncbi:MAG: DNA alkylation repair protein [Spirochaetia bacterium]|nr:DNA alkylation repair protein [Spirochaetia bacterium]